MKASRKTKIITCLIISLIAFKFSGYGGTTNKTEKTYEGTYEVIVVKIYDGDTITVNIPAFPDIIGHNINIRLNGIDTPELTDKRIEMKQKALLARQFVDDTIRKSRKVEITDLRRDKYFRIDAQVIIDGVNLNQLLLKNGYARPYDGGTKSPW
jgi:endonuclease YncB( thermonuclease family)